MKNLMNSFAELFFPRLCVCCDNRLTTAEVHVCIECFLQIPKTNYTKENDNKTADVLAGRFPFIHADSFAYFVKGGTTQKIIHEIKYKSNSTLGIYMGVLCGKEIQKKGLFQDIDFIVAVPLHKNRLKKRGYNQSLVIAKGISQIIKKPISEGSFVRVINNISQTKKTRLERWENTDDTFQVVDKSIFENKHILLIDDVITTGSTIEVCAKLILRCAGAKISIYSVGLAV